MAERERGRLVAVCIRTGPPSCPPGSTQVCGPTSISTRACPHFCASVTAHLWMWWVCWMFRGIGRHSSPLPCVPTGLCREKLLSSSLAIFRAFPLPVWDNEGAGIRIPFVSGGDTEAQKEVVPHPGCPAQENTVSAGLRSPRPPSASVIHWKDSVQNSEKPPYSR